MKRVRKPMCFIPARSGSKRLPRKNIADLDGIPLIAWTIKCAIDSEIFDDIYVSSEDKETLSIAKKWKANPVDRDKKLASDETTLLELCLEEIPRIDSDGKYTDLYLMLPTSPFRKAESVRRAWSEFITSEADTIMSIVPCSHPPQWSLKIKDEKVRPLLPDKYETNRYEVEKAYKHDGGHIITRISSLYEKRKFIVDNTIPFLVSEQEALDINEEVDMEWAKFIIERNKRIVNEKEK